ncbi:MAG: hypothetical protein JWM14_3013 [Chitinophagaceae bacterium]|nr:hypothetical protein [Chitinophagaceae bacterium]
MKKYYPYLFLLTSALFSCSSKEVVKEIVEVPALRASYIYNADSVLKYLELNKDNYKDLSVSYLYKSSDAVDKDLDKAIYFCKRAITLHPELDLYKALGDLLTKAKRYDEAYSLYSFLTYKHYSHSSGHNSYIFSEPSEDVKYESIILHFLRYGYLNGYEIYEYKEDGLDPKKLEGKLLADERFKIDTSTVQYKNFKLMFMTDEEIEEYKSSRKVYDGFLASITDTSSLFDINAKQVQNFKYSNGDSEMEGITVEENSFYINFLQEKKEHPDRWYDYNYNHIYPLYGNITAIVYAIDTSEAGCPKEMRHIYHRLALYNDKGEILDHKIIAFQSGEDLATATVNQSDVTVKFFKRKWRNPYKKNDFDNDLLSVEEVGSVSYKMNADGKILQSGNQPETVPTPL